MSAKKFIRKIIPVSILRFYHYTWALAGAVIFGFPGESKNIKIIGVTGTSGKSTTCDLLARILEDAGNKVASISTIRFKIADREWENKYKMTMPGRFIVQKFLKQAVDAGCKFAVLEVTSQGIEQFRHKFINFDTAVFTNLTPEHIESHKGFYNYREEKLKLFKATKNIHVVNGDDENAKYFLDVSAQKKVIFKLENADNIEAEEFGISFYLYGEKFELNLPGRFNIYNALAAIFTAKNYDIPLSICSKAIKKAKGISGRMEIISKSPIVVVDYAHTPDQLESVYKTFSGKSLICVFGSCGGGRDKWKRPVLGEIAKKYCREIIVTNEDPYDEDPQEIINQIADFAGDRVKKILDRKIAIKNALKLARADDVVIITGKGSEPWMCVKNGKKIPWDDREIVREFLERSGK